MIFLQFIHLLHLVFLLSGNAAKPMYTPHYDFSKPDKQLVLPEILHEISGLTYIDSSIFACIQDEDGILFFYDLEKSKIVKQYTFFTQGDYEGITRVGNTLYVLRSDGFLFEIENYELKNFEVRSYDTGIPATNNEGLCYDKGHNRLLIACKGKIGKGKEFKDERVIYGFDLQTKKLNQEPAYEFDLKKIIAFASANNPDIRTKTRKKKGKSVTQPFIRFRTSDIGIHPVTKELYALSGPDHMLLIFSAQGNIEHIEQLDSELFMKAEGITFNKSGDVLISNEGRDKKPTVLFFKYKKN